MKVIIINQARCKECGDVLIVKSKNETATCRCGKLTVDGNRDFLQRCLEERRASWVKQSAELMFD